MAARRPIDWKRAADVVAAALPFEHWHPAVRAWLDGKGRSRATWGVAVSGGADSLALLLSLWAHRPKSRAQLRVLHFDHRLRGSESRADARFCREVCAALKVKFVLGTWKRRPGRAKVSEAEAREARHAFFRQHARVLWLGHHADDVAETMLMRLARGSGAGGLSAPRPVQPMPRSRVYLRPLLDIRKAVIVGVLSAAGVPWCEDRTNRAGDFFRNRIRGAVLPAWEEAARRDAVAGAALTRELLAEDDGALDAWVDELQPVTDDGDLLLDRLQGRPRAVLRRALRRWVMAQRPAVDISRQAFDTLLRAVEVGMPTRQSIGRNAFAVLRKGRMRREFGKPQRKFRRGVN